jgi:hypothetical protein
LIPDDIHPNGGDAPIAGHPRKAFASSPLSGIRIFTKISDGLISSVRLIL